MHWELFTLWKKEIFCFCDLWLWLLLLTCKQCAWKEFRHKQFPSFGFDVTMPPISQSNPKHSGQPPWDVCESVYVFVRQCMASSAKGARHLSGLSLLDVSSWIAQLQLFHFLCLEWLHLNFKSAVFNTFVAFTFYSLKSIFNYRRTNIRLGFMSLILHWILK